MLVRLHIWLLVLLTPMIYPQTKWVIVSGCKLRISGSTNVNKFGCEVTEYTSADTIAVYNNDGMQQPMIMTGRISLDVHRFDCANAMMTKDLRKILKTKNYPLMHIRFVSLNKLPCWKIRQEAIHGVVDIELAGVVKKYNIEYTFSKDAQNLITLTGKQQVCFSDFNLQPPRKLGGMVQAKDQLNVLFCLKLKAIGNNL